MHSWFWLHDQSAGKGPSLIRFISFPAILLEHLHQPLNSCLYPSILNGLIPPHLFFKLTLVGFVSKTGSKTRTFLPVIFAGIGKINVCFIHSTK